jgi:hypothetical protein
MDLQQLGYSASAWCSTMPTFDAIATYAMKLAIFLK